MFSSLRRRGDAAWSAASRCCPRRTRRWRRCSRTTSCAAACKLLKGARADRHRARRRRRGGALRRRPRRAQLARRARHRIGAQHRRPRPRRRRRGDGPRRLRRRSTTTASSNSAHIYAAGDVSGKLPLSSVASDAGPQGGRARDGPADRSSTVTSTTTRRPSAIFTEPEIADVGLAEAEAFAVGPQDPRHQGAVLGHPQGAHQQRLPGLREDHLRPGHRCGARRVDRRSPRRRAHLASSRSPSPPTSRSPTSSRACSCTPRSPKRWPKPPTDPTRSLDRRRAPTGRLGRLGRPSRLRGRSGLADAGRLPARPDAIAARAPARRPAHTRHRLGPIRRPTARGRRARAEPRTSRRGLARVARGRRSSARWPSDVVRVSEDARRASSTAARRPAARWRPPAFGVPSRGGGGHRPASTSRRSVGAAPRQASATTPHGVVGARSHATSGDAWYDRRRDAASTPWMSLDGVSAGRGAGARAVDARDAVGRTSRRPRLVRRHPSQAARRAPDGCAERTPRGPAERGADCRGDRAATMVPGRPAGGAGRAAAGAPRSRCTSTPPPAVGANVPKDAGDACD